MECPQLPNLLFWLRVRDTRFQASKIALYATGQTAAGHKLAGIDLSGMPLLTIDFTDAFLGDANMRNANLSNVNFNNAYLGKADLRETLINHLSADSETMFQARSFYKADFSEAALGSVVANKAQFYGSKWDGASLVQVRLTNSDFRKADFSNAMFIRQTR